MPDDTYPPREEMESGWLVDRAVSDLVEVERRLKAEGDANGAASARVAVAAALNVAGLFEREGVEASSGRVH
jgi:hypothetical protein